MNIKTLLILLMILVYCNVLAAEELTVYRWIDKNNVVHFSQNQPSHDDYIEISMANNKKSSAIIDEKTSTEKPQPIDIVPSDTNDNNDKCVTARENIEILQNFDKIQYKDVKGNVKVLGAVEKEQQLAMNTKQAEVYCAN
jgi:hypothetical protein